MKRILLIVLLPLCARAERSAREAVAASLPFLKGAGESWIADKKCVSCHHTGMLIWSAREAQAKGFEVAVSDLADWSDWAFVHQRSDHEKGGKTGARNLEGLGQLMLGRAPEDDVADFRQLMVAGQQADGSWSPNGQLPLQKRSKEETTVASTAWIWLALQDENHPDSQASRDKAMDWLQEAPPGKSTEVFAQRLLMADALKAGVAEAREALLNRQHEDGGWPWVEEDASDALGTGLALYALKRSGTKGDSLTRAQAFLLRTQEENGSWKVHSTKAKKRTSVEPTAIFWGTAWALLALLEDAPQEE